MTRRERKYHKLRKETLKAIRKERVQQCLDVFRGLYRIGDCCLASKKGWDAFNLELQRQGSLMLKKKP